MAEFTLPGAGPSLPARFDGSDRVRAGVRWLAVLILIILLIGFALLYIWPADTERLFAWPIKPPTTDLVMGAGYGAGAFFWWRVLTARRWHYIGIGLLATTAFTWAMALATLLHWDRFSHGHLIFEAWVVIYAATPLIVPALWLANRRADPGHPDPDDVIVPPAVRWLFAVTGAAMLTVATLMFAMPVLFIDRWGGPSPR